MQFNISKKHILRIKKSKLLGPDREFGIIFSIFVIDYTNKTTNLFKYKTPNFVINFKRKMIGKYLRYKNKTMKQALYYLETTSDDGNFICPDCYEHFTNKRLFDEHLQKVHGYPDDIDVFKFHSRDTISPNSHVEKANPKYLKYL